MEKTTLAHKSEVKRSNGHPPANSQIRQHSSHSSCGGCGACHKISRSTNTFAGIMLKSLDPGKKICATRFLQRTYGNQYVQRLIQTKMDSPCLQRCGSRTIQMNASGCCGGCANHGKEEEGVQMQAKLTIGQPGDKYEQEADRVYEQVMRMPEPQVQRQPIEEEEEEFQMKSLSNQITPIVQRQPIEEEEEELQTKEASGSTPDVTPDLETRLNTSKGGGQPLPKADRSFMEIRFGSDFSGVRVHTNGDSVQMNRELNAAAFTTGKDIYFGAGGYSPRTASGKKLLAHELTHVVQQGRAHQRAAGAPTESMLGVTEHSGNIQRTLGDYHDLTSPRFSRLLDLEAAYDDETLIGYGSSGRGVQAIQQALYDIGYPLLVYGADGKFGYKTKAAVKAFQRDRPPLAIDGVVGPHTMAALDARFSGAPALPAPAVLSAPWTSTCVRSVLCPWSPHTIDVLRTRITLKSFDSISWADEVWDGASWIPAPFPGDGYNTGTEIGVLNSSCESMSETLYHEVLHAEQPTTHRTTREKESYAYRIGEEFSIAMGLGGQPALRSTDVQGREFADPAKVGTFVSSTYPSVPAGGGGDEIIGKAATHGHVRVQRPSGTIYTRPAAVGEKVPGPMTIVSEVTHPTAGWTCP